MWTVSTESEDSSTSDKESKYEYLKVIGEGSFSTVYLCRNKNTDVKYALKKCSKATIINKKAIKLIFAEKNILILLSNKHPLIITLIESFKTPDSLVFVFEYCENRDLLHLIDSRKPLFWESVVFYAAQLISALEFIHNNNVVHRDVKPSNILLDERMNIKLSDFGAAMVNETEDLERTRLDKSSNFVGTAEYVSPEVLKGKEVDFRCDLWALGCVVFHLVVGCPPFRSSSTLDVFSKVIKGSLLYPDDFDVLEDDAHSLISRLVVVDPAERLGSGEQGDLRSIRRHRFFSNVDWSLPISEQRSPERPLGSSVDEAKEDLFVEVNFTRRRGISIRVMKPSNRPGEKSGFGAMVELTTVGRKKPVVVVVDRLKVKSDSVLTIRLESDMEFDVLCPSCEAALELADAIYG